MKVFELAKELGMQSKEIITLLNNKGIDVKSHMSVVDDSAVAMVKSQAGGKSSKSDAQGGKNNTKADGMSKEEKMTENQNENPAATGKKESGKKEQTPETAKSEQSADIEKKDQTSEAGAETPKKKKNIIFVSNPQNSKISGSQGNRQQMNNNGNRQQMNNNGNRRQNQQGGYGNNNRSNSVSQPYRQQQQLIRPMIQPSVPDSVSAADLRAQRADMNHEKNVKNQELNNSVAADEVKNNAANSVPVTDNSKQPSANNIKNDSNPSESKAIEGKTIDSIDKSEQKQVQGTVENTEKAAAPEKREPQAASSERSQRPQSSGDNQRPYGDRPQGTGYNRDGQRPQGNRDGQRPQGNRDGQRPYGDRPQGTGYTQRPQGDRPQGNRDNQRPYGDRPQGTGYNRDGQRPQGTGYTQRPYGDRPQGTGYNRDGQRPQGTGYTQRPYGDRPQGSGYNRDGQRPQGTGYTQRPYGDRPQGSGYNRDGQRPQGTGYTQRPYGDRPQGTGYNRDGQRPQGTGYTQRPYGDRNQGNRGGFGGGFNKDETPDRPYGKGPADRAKKPANKLFGGDVTLKEHRDEDKRRIGQEKDKKNKKDLIYEEEGDLKVKKAGRFIKPEKKPENNVVEEIKVITIPEEITIKDLADKMHIQASQIVKKLFLQGTIVTVNQLVKYDFAENVAIEYDIMCEKEIPVDIIEELLKEEDENTEELTTRPPVICVMGHVDHGKTSLLDAIRKTNVTSAEAGGITQAIGAYTVAVKGRSITFLDTPGHEAFTAMRMRGANATDIAILVVAADDGVMPQTIEAINHAKAAGIEIVVAINKIDRPNANVQKVKQELTEYGLVSSEWGGSTTFVPVSAKTGEGINDLLEMILLTADVMELKANASRRARGLVIESELDKGRGPVATVLVQKGTLHIGDFISAGKAHGKVRAMIDDKKNNLKEAGPSTPVKILGLNDVPAAGEVFIAHENDKEAKHFAQTFIEKGKNKLIDETKSRMSLDDLFTQIKAGNLKDLNLIVKADVQGSVEAVKQSLVKLSNDEVVVRVIHDGVGTINESDVELASVSKAIIIGFNVRIDATAKATSEREGVDVRLYKVIYQAIEDVELAMKGMLDPVYEEKVIGHAEVRQIFKAAAIGNIAGSFVMDGMFQRNCKVRISREGKQIFEGQLASLKRFKDDVKEVKAGYECGLVFEGFDQIEELDMVEAYIMVEVPRV